MKYGDPPDTHLMREARVALANMSDEERAAVLAEHMPARRLQLRIREHRREVAWSGPVPFPLEEVRIEEYRLESNRKPAFIVVVRDAAPSERRAIIQALDACPEAKKLAGCPILFLDNGVEFELWEIGREGRS